MTEPAASENPGTAPGWYPHPTNPHEVRLWDGEKWTGDTAVAGASRPMNFAPKPPLMRQYAALSIALQFAVVAVAASTLAEYLALRGLYQFWVGKTGLTQAQVDEGVGLEAQLAAASLTGIAVVVAAGLLWVTWLYQGHKSSAAPFTVTPRWWTVGGWLIPIANLFLPFMATKDAYESAHARAGTHPHRALLYAWWGSYLALWLAGRVDAVYWLGVEDAEAFKDLEGALKASTDANGALLAITLIATVLAIAVIRSMTRALLAPGELPSELAPPAPEA